MPVFHYRKSSQQLSILGDWICTGHHIYIFSISRGIVLPIVQKWSLCPQDFRYRQLRSILHFINILHWLSQYIFCNNRLHFYYCVIKQVCPTICIKQCNSFVDLIHNANEHIVTSITGRIAEHHQMRSLREVIHLWRGTAQQILSKSDIGVEGFLLLLAKLRRNFIHQLSRQAALTVEQMYSRLIGPEDLIQV